MKYCIVNHSENVKEIIIPIFSWSVRRAYIEAMVEVSQAFVATSVEMWCPWNYHYIVTGYPKKEGK